ncbi:TonB-dependent receptor [Sphingomonas bacterium]|uniref:TonB-dependent receptor n=1 Tax=Sphingomonas bacterium TaxID=1895847 RepID=UPI0015772BB8|nr:TonB-dependent receptor [Sphingomonas bacterium]
MTTTSVWAQASSPSTATTPDGAASQQTAPSAQPPVASEGVANGSTDPAAQAAPATAVPAPSDGADTGALAEIVVTAQKRAENLQRVPIAVSATSGLQLANAGITSITQIATFAPGVNVKVTQGSFQPSIRGISTSSSVVENPVALYIDGVYYPQQREGLRDLLDIDQIAVLKGPQGTLFGRNATAGVFQVTTRKPTHEFTGEATASIDNYSTFIGNLYLSGGLTDTLAASLSAQVTTQGEGWGRDRSTGNPTGKVLHNAGVRGKLLFEPDARTAITLIGDYTNREQYAEAFQPYPGTRLSYPGLCVLRSKYDSCGGLDGRVGFKGGGASVTIDRELSFAKLLSISSYRRGNGTYQFDNGQISPTVFGVFSPKNRNEDYTEELQLISTAKSRFTWVLGGFYFHNLNSNEPITRLISGPLAPAPTSAVNNTAYGVETTESVAPFAQATWEFVPSFKLTGGVRYTFETRDLAGRTQLTLRNGTQINTDIARHVSIEKPTFRAALDHEFSDTVLGYVSFNTGFKSGGYNILAPATPPYAPETLRAYEAGLKTELFDRKARLNFAGFYYDYTNLQVTQVINNQQTVFNGAKAELYGLDVDLEARLTRELKLTGGLEALHAEFTSFPNAQFGTQRPTGGAIIGAGDAAGKRLPLAQKLTGNVALDYDTPIASGRVHANVTASYNGDYRFEPDNVLRQPAYVLLNTSLRWTSPDGHFSATLFGRNLLDKIVIERTSTQGQGYPTIYGFAPRTYGVSAGLKF